MTSLFGIVRKMARKNVCLMPNYEDRMCSSMSWIEVRTARPRSDQKGEELPRKAGLTLS